MSSPSLIKISYPEKTKRYRETLNKQVKLKKQLDYLAETQLSARELTVFQKELHTVSSKKTEWNLCT